MRVGVGVSRYNGIDACLTDERSTAPEHVRKICRHFNTTRLIMLCASVRTPARV